MPSRRDCGSCLLLPRWDGGPMVAYRFAVDAPRGQRWMGVRADQQGHAEFVAQLRVAVPLTDLTALIEAERDHGLDRPDGVASAYDRDRLEEAAAELVALQVERNAQ